MDVSDYSTDSALAQLVGVASSSGSGEDMRRLLRRILASACELTGAQIGSMAILAAPHRDDEPRGELLQLITHGLDDGERAAVHASPPKALVSQVALMAQPTVAISDVVADDSFLGFPDGYPFSPNLLAVPIRGAVGYLGEFYLSGKCDSEGAAVAFTDSDRTQMVALAEVSTIVLENLHSFRVSERRRRWLEMFSDLADLLAGPLPLSSAFERVAAASKVASDANATAILTLPDADSLVVSAHAGDTKGGSSTDWSWVEGLVRESVRENAVRTTVDSAGRTAVIAPLMVQLSDPGALVLIHEADRHLALAEERDLLSSFAEHVALSLDRTQALADRETMSVIADRDRIARDLHDVVIQRLFATGLSMASLRAAANDQPELKERVDAVVSDLDQTIRDIRRTIFDLKQPAQTSLRTEVAALVREFVPLLGFAPSVHLSGQVDLAIDEAIYQRLCAVIRESLNNVAKHAAAGDAKVELKVASDRVTLVVTDNGQGLPDVPKLNGLRNVRRWASMLGGTASLDSQPGGGTRLEWDVPLNAT